MYYSAQQTVGGEIKNVRRNSYVAMLLTIVIGISFCVVVIYLAENVMGYRFLEAIAAVSGTSAYTIPITTPYYNYLVGVLVTNPIILWIMGLFFIGWDIALVMLNFVMVPRYLLASSMDRITPGFLARVSDRFHTPYVGIWLVVICGSIMLVMYTMFAGFFSTLSAVLGEMIAAYLLFSIAAIIFPFRKSTKPMFDASPIAYKVAGIPVLSILGVISTVVLLSIGYMFLVNSMYGVNSFYSLLGIVLITIGAVIIFVASYAYNRKHGLDIMMAFQQIPPE
jgi:amino acid transporter